MQPDELSRASKVLHDRSRYRLRFGIFFYISVMENFYDTQMMSLEDRIAPKKTSPILAATLHNKSSNPENLYYVKYILGTGRAQICNTAKDTPCLPMQPTTPNERLICQLSNFLSKINFSHNLKTIAGQKTVIIQEKDGMDVTTLLVQSKPLNGISYVHITKLSTDNLGEQLTASFVANTPEMIVAKLMDHHAMNCPKTHACLTHCADCPEL